MATPDNLDNFRKAQRDLTALAYRELIGLWATLDTRDALAVRKALEEFLPMLIRAYGEAGASAAADFYDELRESRGIKETYRAVMGEAIPAEQIQASARWAISPLFREDPDPDLALRKVSGITQRYVRAGGRGTIMRNIARDPGRARYARVPTGTSTCAFCIMLASRGAVYLTEDTANGAEGFHDGKCDCEVMPVWSEDDLVQLKESHGYDASALKDRYEAALKQSDGGLKGDDGILHHMREMYGFN